MTKSTVQGPLFARLWKIFKGVTSLLVSRLLTWSGSWKLHYLHRTIIRPRAWKVLQLFYLQLSRTAA